MLGHYVDLLRARWPTVLACSVGAGVLAVALSWALLQTSALYSANVAVTMQPSEEDLRFNQAFMGVSQFNPATVIAQTHIERLLSRPVAERALDILMADFGGALPKEEVTIVTRLKIWAWTVWSIANYGYFVPTPEREQLIKDIQDAIDIEIVEGSYILNVEMIYDDPTIVAAAANAVAEAYVEVARTNFLREADEVDRIIAASEVETRNQLLDRRAERAASARRHGVHNIGAERTVLIQARQDASQALNDAVIGRRGEEARLASLRLTLPQQSDVALVREIQQDLALGEATLDLLSDTIGQRREALARIEASLNALQTAEEDLAGIDAELVAIDLDLQELQSRRVALDLATKAHLSQVLVIDPAIPPDYPFFPKVLVNGVVATIVGGILALVPIFALDALGSHVRTYLDLQQIVGGRALPSVSLRMSFWRRRAWRKLVDALARRIAGDPRGWSGDVVAVTGFLDEAKLKRFARFMGEAAAGLAWEGQPLRTLALPQFSDWSEAEGRIVVVVLPTGAVERLEVEALKQHADEQGLRAYFVVLL